MKEPDIGEVINRKWRLLEKLGEGGMGWVYKAQHAGMSTLIRALKMLSLTPDKQTLERFNREANVMAKCEKHGNIVQIFDYECDPKYTPYLVMEYVEGVTLKTHLEKEGALKIPAVLNIARQVAKALQWAHTCDPPVIHRDIKPANIMIENRTGRVVVMDFGIAKELGATGLTRFGVAPGTLKYMSSEQLRVEELDGRSDIYALGMVMYEAYAGRHPLADLDDDDCVREVRDNRAEFDVSFIENEAFRDLVRKAIAKSRDQRYGNIVDFSTDLEGCQRKLEIEGAKPAAEVARQRIQECGFREDAGVLRSKAREKYTHADTLLLQAEQHWETQAYTMAKQQYDLAYAAYTDARAAANYWLGEEYYDGAGTEPDYMRATECYRKAADQGHPEAQTSLGFLYENGSGVTRDDVQAVMWYRKAAEQKEPYGQANLGLMYGAGKGVPQDDVEAIKWYRLAADQSHASAQYSLGLSYEYGLGVTKDAEEAMRWYRKAAAQGDPHAQRKVRESGGSPDST